jgi:outer membrane protein
MIMTVPSLFKMMVVKTALAGLLFLPVSTFAQAPPKIGTVDLKKVFDNYFRTKLADAQLKERIASDENVLKGMLEDFEKLNEEFGRLSESAADPVISAEERERRKKNAERKLLELQELERTVTQFRRETVTRLEEQNKRMRERIIADIREEVTKQAKAGNFTMVIDTAAESRNHTPVLLYFTSQHDLTDQILEAINRAAPRETR